MLLAHRVDLGLTCFINFPILPHPPDGPLSAAGDLTVSAMPVLFDTSAAAVFSGVLTAGQEVVVKGKLTVAAAGAISAPSGVLVSDGTLELWNDVTGDVRVASGRLVVADGSPTISASLSVGGGGGYESK